jgi:hypothetical protein
MRGTIAILILFMFTFSPAAAKCCSLGGGGASYNFLGDSAVDINMDSYDEFARENVPAAAAIPDVRSSATSRLSLFLSDNGSIYLLLSQAGGKFSGLGNATEGNVTGPAQAVGMLQANKLSLDVTAPGKEVYKFSLATEGSTVMGDYSLALPDGERLNGTTQGKWEI